jgi:four helix bundle protein
MIACGERNYQLPGISSKLIGKKPMAFAFEELQVYQKALDFSVAVIDVVDNLETNRKHYRLIGQLEAACTSVALNIAEGKGRYSKKEFRHFLYISRGSLYETVAVLQIFQRKSWLESKTCQSLYEKAEEISRMLSGLIKSL